jgi:hypothetical protein
MHFVAKEVVAIDARIMGEGSIDPEWFVSLLGFMVAPRQSVINRKEGINKLLTEHNIHGAAYSARESWGSRGGSQTLPFQLVLVLDECGERFSTFEFIGGATIDNPNIPAKPTEVINDKSLEINNYFLVVGIYANRLCNKALWSVALAPGVWIQLQRQTKSWPVIISHIYQLNGKCLDFALLVGGRGGSSPHSLSVLEAKTQDKCANVAAQQNQNHAHVEFIHRFAKVAEFAISCFR